VAVTTSWIGRTHSVLFFTMKADGMALSTASLAASNSCSPPSQLWLNVIVIVVAPTGADGASSTTAYGVRAQQQVKWRRLKFEELARDGEQTKIYFLHFPQIDTLTNVHNKSIHSQSEESENQRMPFALVLNVVYTSILCLPRTVVVVPQNVKNINTPPTLR
jgi:hypothetical protein